MSNLVAALRAELNELQAELQRDPRYKRLQKIRELLALYEPNAAAPLSPPPMAPSSASHHSVEPNRPLEGLTTKRAKVLAEIRSLLKSNGRMHRAKILEHLVAKGLMGKETKPLQALAIYLSEAGQFVNDGEGNWSLKAEAA